MGHLLESFVVQQLTAQAAWTDPDLRFWHYRDKDRVEVDVTGDLEVTEEGALTIQTEMESLGELTISTHGRGIWWPDR